MKHANIAFFIPHVGCPNRCSFCNQNTISGETSLVHADEISCVLKNALESMDVDMLKNSEIAFFGGSFTAIDRDYMLELLECANEFVGEKKFSGIRISTRPDAIDDQVLMLLKKYNVTAIELGAQSMDDEVLRKNFRGHSSDDVVKASNKIREYGFSLGLQMMTGLYGDTVQKSIATAQKIIEICPDTVRIYPTVVLKDTYLEKLFKSGEYIPFGVEETVSLCAQLVDLFEEKNTKVIRVGLHDQPSLKENFVAGAYHAALGELISGERFYNKMLEILSHNNQCEGNMIFNVNPRCVSKAIGQNKRNIKRLKKLGFDMKIIADNNIKENDIKLS